MAFFWLLFGADGGAAGRSDGFADRDAAEAWLGERWADLRDSGVDEVRLHDELTEVYRMSLAEDDAAG
jgi:hypothetical protein